MTVANVISHNLLQGNEFDGAVPDVAPLTQTADSPTLGGVVQAYEGGTSGGLFEFSKMAPRTGVTLIGVLHRGVGTTGFTLDILSRELKDGGGTSPTYRILTHALAEFTNKCASADFFGYYPTNPILIPPGHDLRFRGNTQNNAGLNSEGRLTIIVGPGLGQPTGFVQVKSN